MVVTILQLTGLIAITGLAIWLAVTLARCRRSLARKPADAQTVDAEKIVFLFAGQNLIDATQPAWDIFGQGSSSMDDLGQLRALFASDFPDFPDRLRSSGDLDLRLRSIADATIYLDIKRTGERLRLSLGGDPGPLDRLTALRLPGNVSSADSDLMRAIAKHSDQLVWHNGEDGALIWANRAYMTLLDRLNLRSLLDGQDAPAAGQSVRLAVADNQVWLDITAVAHAGGTLYFGTDVSHMVRASKAKRDFVETVGRTFAELSTGLAIFDRNRLLTMFNPAFTDMTNLPIDFLTGRPAIDTLLDRLREMRMMPEPKDYLTWREQFMALEAGAKNGTYSRNWSLADGQTYRVTGRPYPDGAFALLFEDVSAEISLTRRFRLDIETGQAVLDSLDDAIAVFSASGTLVMSNRAYTTLWSDRPEQVPEQMLEQRLLPSELKLWQDQSIPSPVWADMQDYIQRPGTRTPWADDALLEDGRHVRCQAHRLPRGMTMVRFVIAPPKRPQITASMPAPQMAQALKG